MVNPAVPQYDDPVRQAEGRYPLGDNNRGPAGHQVAQFSLDFLFGTAIQAGSAVVEDQDLAIRFSARRIIPGRTPQRCFHILPGGS
jgi:hypothetical protein